MENNNLSAIRPKLIAVATDLTDLDYLLPQAKAQASATGATLWLVHVIPPQVYVSPASGAYPFVPKEKALLDVERILAKKAEELQKEGFACKYEIRRWFEAEQIAAFVREKKIDRLIIGSSGKSKLGKFLLGSVAEELIRTIDIPVCTIGPHVEPPKAPKAHEFLYAASLRHHAESSFEFAVEIAAVAKATLTVLHVVEDTSAHSQQEFDARIKIDYLLRRPALTVYGVNTVLRFGDPAKEILREASQRRPEMLILGAVPATAFTATIRTGVAYEVIKKALCPVLTLRESLREISAASDTSQAVASHVGA